jgi:hypothetical protein
VTEVLLKVHVSKFSVRNVFVFGLTSDFKQLLHNLVPLEVVGLSFLWTPVLDGKLECLNLVKLLQKFSLVKFHQLRVKYWSIILVVLFLLVLL